MANTRSRTPIPPHHRPDCGFSPESEGADHRKTHRRPWKHMADTYVWVEHHCAPDPRRRKTEKWVQEQQVFHPPPYGWMQEEEAAKRSIARESERARMIQEELRRIEERIRHRRETERRRVAAERARFLGEVQQKEKTEMVFREAWRRYEKGWQEILANTTGEITFSTIPWPLATRPTTCEDIDLKDIREFLMSPYASETQVTAKERIRKAQLRWHPDRFRRVLERVVVDKKQVEEAAGIVARSLNEMMAA
ncbi:hypothetical protein FB45DRAFT_892909 [Roridomyces roridus]|uniref:J domain-containing protein n=1 Tax=Roridomyces roridus TaxID=1738132 RepID=A0AAD7FWK3_9AGAR|nr:hypothetical protein FB45DRAFT_892909 [Roridomyces roridus]